MSTVSEIHESALRLSPAEREHLALLVWESLEMDLEIAAEDSLG